MSLNALLNIISVGKLKEQNTSYCDPYSMVQCTNTVEHEWLLSTQTGSTSHCFWIPTVSSLLAELSLCGYSYIIMISITVAGACGDTAMCIQDTLTVTWVPIPIYLDKKILNICFLNTVDFSKFKNKMSYPSTFVKQVIMRYFLWDVTQRGLVVSYQCFRVTCWFHL